MILGLYKHYKGGWYIAFKKNKRNEVLYFGLKHLEFYTRPAHEFFDTIPMRASDNSCSWREFRFSKFTLRKEVCYCRELDAYQSCPRHGYPQYGNHMRLPRFDGHEHEQRLR